MNPIFVYHEIAKTSFKAAESNLSNDDMLIYVALQLRCCVEALSYRLLVSFIDDLGAGEIKDWVPYKVMKAIKALDPDADKAQEFTLFKHSVGKHDYSCCGTYKHTPISGEGLAKLFQKLSNYIHVPTISQLKASAKSSQEIRAFLLEVITRLRPAVYTQTTELRVKSSVNFNCLRCGELVLARLTTRKHFKTVIECQHCQAPHYFERSESGSRVNPYGTPVPCQCNDCKGSYIVWDDFKTKTKQVTCSACGDKQHIFFATDKQL